MRRVPLVLGGVALLAAILFTGCRRPSAVETATEAGILLLGNGPDPQTLDPHLATSIGALQINFALREGLVRFDHETMAPLPGLAESWTLSDDGETFTFYLRTDATWSDGTPLTAADVVASWERLLNPALGSGNAPLLYFIEGAQAYHQGLADDFATVGIQARGLFILEVRLATPAPFFLSVLMHPALAPVPLAAIDANGGRYDRGNDWSTRPGPVNGPFILEDWQPNRLLAVTQNDAYHAADRIQLNGVHFLPFAEPATEERAFRAGQLHVTDALPPARAAALREAAEPALRIEPYLGTYYILLNHTVEPLGDPRTRAALAAALDREAIVNRLLGAGQTVATQFTPTKLLPPADETSTPFDPARAQALLAEAGYPQGAGFPSLVYLFNTSESHRQIGEALQAMWREHLGLDITLENVEWRTYLARRAEGDYAMARAVWIGDYADPYSFLQLWHPASPNNWIGWDDAAYGDALATSLATPDPATRQAAFRAAEARLQAETAVIPLYHYTTAYLQHPTVEGWAGNLLDWPDFTAVRLTD